MSAKARIRWILAPGRQREPVLCRIRLEGQVGADAEDGVRNVRHKGVVVERWTFGGAVPACPAGHVRFRATTTRDLMPTDCLYELNAIETGLIPDNRVLDPTDL